MQFVCRCLNILELAPKRNVTILKSIKSFLVAWRPMMGKLHDSFDSDDSFDESDRKNMPPPGSTPAENTKVTVTTTVKRRDSLSSTQSETQSEYRYVALLWTFLYLGSLDWLAIHYCQLHHLNFHNTLRYIFTTKAMRKGERDYLV